MIGPSTVSIEFPTKPLGEVVEFLDHLRKPITASDREPGPIPYYGANGQQDLVAGWIFDEPLVLLAEDGGHFDSPDRGIAYQIEGKSWVNNHAHVLRTVGNLDARWLARVLENYDVTQFLTGSTRAKLTKSGASRIPIPLPPIEEQRRIAAVLDAADTLRAKRRHALAKLDTLTQAMFIAMFGDPFRPSALTVPLADIATIVMGQSPPGDSYNATQDGTPLLNGPSEFGPAHPTAVQWTTAPIRTSMERDILFCVRGATAGRLNWSDQTYCLGRGLAAIRAEPSRRAFLYLVLAAYYPRFQSEGVGSTFINISKKDLHRVPIPVAEDDLVAEFADVQSGVDLLRTRMMANLEELDTLFASLQQRAFRGDL